MLLTDSAGDTQVVKTGMGSSAALTTSLVGGLLGWFKVIELDAKSDKYAEDRRVLHNLAQLAHAVAQGKIGSGFDVAAAVYGTQTYKRFSPEVQLHHTITSQHITSQHITSHPCSVHTIINRPHHTTP